MRARLPVWVVRTRVKPSATFCPTGPRVAEPLCFCSLSSMVPLLMLLGTTIAYPSKKNARNGILPSRGRVSWIARDSTCEFLEVVGIVPGREMGHL